MVFTFAAEGMRGTKKSISTAPGIIWYVLLFPAIAQTCAAGCGEYANRYEEKACENGHLEFICSRNPQTESIVRTALLGLDEAVRQYPEQVQRGDIDVG